MPIGSVRMRLPVAAKIALISAGAKGARPGSPTPLGGNPLFTTKPPGEGTGLGLAEIDRQL